MPLSWDVSKEFKLPSLTSYCFSVTSHLSLRFFSSALFNIFLPSLDFFCLVLTLHLNLFQPRLHSSSHTFQRRTYAYFFIPTIQRNIHGILASCLNSCFSGSGVQPRRTGGGEGHNHRNPESEHAHLTR